jgi:hypothetical protein
MNDTYDEYGNRIAYAHKGKRVYIATDFGDGEVAVHPQGLDNQDARIVVRADLVAWSAYEADMDKIMEVGFLMN